jgi:hypothetical protein
MPTTRFVGQDLDDISTCMQVFDHDKYVLCPLG